MIWKKRIRRRARVNKNVFVYLPLFVQSPDHPGLKLTNNIFYLVKKKTRVDSCILFPQKTETLSHKSPITSVYSLFIPHHTFGFCSCSRVPLCTYHLLFKFSPQSLGRGDGRQEKKNGYVEVEDGWIHCCRNSGLLSEAVDDRRCKEGIISHSPHFCYLSPELVLHWLCSYSWFGI